MKAFSLIALVLLLCGCSTPRHDSSRDVKQFYLAWMSAYTQERDTSALMQRYVAKDVINRLALIDGLYEQEILDSDYFMYVQDYDPEWIPLLRVGPAQPFLGGEKVEVQLGGPTGAPPMLLEVYTRWEDRRWKIYRVRNISDHYEQPIYSAGDITRAKAWSAEIAPEYEKMNK
ncbi:YbjP/YqhG family protein [Citrobacter sp. FDAARGOS_156]|uniref:YbjP/YqhG family protein n=1 Tax=Citrobacter sp. FDAARGOS_156 TaxID=1702170 RepID=UPI0019025501|nr:YbjP/YqhG family protein [Citrobacter sp. FDAARGOS_156]MBJ8882747.1 YbjP/YqhG family protein [Citrobacter sp. FDAARGOS_156]HED2480215.1 YbjP/YqhG family protein [Citrobacter youngae]